VEDADDLETVDDGSGQAAAGAGEDVSERKALWSQLKSLIGADVMSLLSVPVFIMEPTTTLQKMSEILQYTELLDVAAAEPDPDVRLAYVCALAISTYSSNERVKKPFNPILGETWEMTLPGANPGVYVSEQVSHHPPIGAGHAETKAWTYDLTSAVKTKFMGNWVDVWPLGRTRIRLKESGEVFNIIPPMSRVNNVLVGRTWIDTHGDLVVNNLTTGAKAVIKFKECNMFGGGRWEVSGDIVGADGEPKFSLVGKWNESVSVTPASGGDAKTLWTKEPMPADPTKYGFTNFTFKQNAGSSCPPGLLASDSRLRPDRAALEAGDSSLAGAQKHALEEAQRFERKVRESKGDTWNPRWFKLAENADLHELERDVGTAVWEWNGEYHAVSEKRAEEAKANGDAANPLESIAFDPWCYDETRKEAAAKE